MTYDPEAVIQDADIEQAQMEALGNHIHRLREAGVCTHQGTVGYRNPPVYPEQEGLKPGEHRCTDGCGEVFESQEAWFDAMHASYDTNIERASVHPSEESER